ncbi:MAG: FAD-dependent monooxygenase [Bernardetiaceae bacterium]
MRRDYDVIVVGGGPVGLAAALFLGQAGLVTLVLEQRQGAYPYPRAVHLDGETLAILEQLGLFPELESAIVPFGEALFLDKDNRPFWRETGQDRYWFYQPRLEALLRERIAALATVDFLEGRHVVGLWQSSEEGRGYVTTHEGTDFSGLFVLGADGSHSTIRELSEIELSSSGFHQEWIVVDGHYTGKATFPARHIQYAHRSRPATYVQGACGHFRWEFRVWPDEVSTDLLQPARLQELLRPYINPDDLAIWRADAYIFTSRVATRWQEGAIFLLGDAAHQMPPFAGQGLCAGLRDAQNLSWRIIAHLQRGADYAILTGYQVERKRHVRHIMRGAMFLGKLLQWQHPLGVRVAQQIFRRIEQTPILRRYIVDYAAGTPPLRLWPKARRHPKVGHLFPRIQPWKHRFYWIARDRSPWPEQRDVFIFETGSYPELEKDGWQNVDWAIIRPDGYVMAAGKASQKPPLEMW